MKLHIAFWVALASILMIALFLSPVLTAFSTPLPQGNATQQQQTIQAGVNQRLTQTLQAIATQTAAAGLQQTINSILNQTLTALGPTPTLTGLSATLSATNTAAPIDPTLQQQTISAIINQRLTQTALGMSGQTATAGFQQTINSAVNQTLTAMAPAQAASTDRLLLKSWI